MSVFVRRLLLAVSLLFFQTHLQAQETTLTTTSIDTTEINKVLKATSKLRYVATDSAITLLFETYAISKKGNYVKGVAGSLVNLGLMYMDKGEYHKSLAIYREAIPYCQVMALVQPKMLILLYNNIAALYGNRNVFDTAAIYYYKALDQYDDHRLKDTALLLTIYNNLAARLATLERVNESKFYLNKAVSLALAINDTKKLARSYATYSGVYAVEKNIDSTRLYANKALAIFDTVQDPSSRITAYCNLAETYLLQPNPEPKKALEIYNKPFEKIKHVSQLALVPAHKGLGKCYYELKDYKRAEEHYAIALAESKKINSFSGQKDAYTALVDIYTATKDYKKALDYRNKYTELIEANLNDEKIKTFGQLEVKYRTAQKDIELAQNKLLLSQQSLELQNKNALIFTISICSAFIILLIINIYRSRKQTEGLQLQALKSEKEVTRLKATMQGEEKERKRIARELHDGIMIQFSSVKMNLSALNETLFSGSSQKMNGIIDSLDEAINDLRKSAHNLMPDMLLKEGLTDAVHYFCVKLQEGTKTEIDFQSYGEMPKIAPEYELMLYRMVQELLQNTLKHAQATKVLVQLNYQPDVVNITVEDDGVGFEPDPEHLNKGMGLRQIKERIAFLNGYCKASKNKPYGTSINIDLETKFLQKNDLT